MLTVRPSSALNSLTQPTRTRTPQSTKLPGLATGPKINSLRPSPNLNSLLLFKITKNPSPSLPGMTSFTSPVLFPIWGFYCDICDCHILPAYAWTPALMSAPAHALSQMVLSLTKPKDKIYKTKTDNILKKSFRHYITCPAKGKICRNCDKMNHFTICCRCRHRIFAKYGEIFPWIYMQKWTSREKSPWPVKLKIGGIPIILKIDTGADINVISTKTFRKLRKRPMLKPPHGIYKSPGSTLTCKGKFWVNTTHKK